MISKTINLIALVTTILWLCCSEANIVSVRSSSNNLSCSDFLVGIYNDEYNTKNKITCSGDSCHDYRASICSYEGFYFYDGRLPDCPEGCVIDQCCADRFTPSKEPSSYNNFYITPTSQISSRKDVYRFAPPLNERYTPEVYINQRANFYCVLAPSTMSNYLRYIAYKQLSWEPNKRTCITSPNDDQACELYTKIEYCRENIVKAISFGNNDSLFKPDSELNLYLEDTEEDRGIGQKTVICMNVLTENSQYYNTFIVVTADYGQDTTFCVADKDSDKCISYNNENDCLFGEYLTIGLGDVPFKPCNIMDMSNPTSWCFQVLSLASKFNARGYHGGGYNYYNLF